MNSPPPRQEKQSKQQAASKLPASPPADSPHSHAQVLKLKRALGRPPLPEVSCIPCGPGVHTLRSAAPAWCLSPPCAPTHGARDFETSTKEDWGEKEGYSVHYAQGTKDAYEPDDSAAAKNVQVGEDVPSARRAKRSGTVHRRLGSLLTVRARTDAGVY